MTKFTPSSVLGTKPSIVINHLNQLGRITDATARAQYGSFRLADAIYRLRNDKAHLVPKGKVIVTVHREDLMGNEFAEYRLVDKALAREFAHAA